MASIPPAVREAGGMLVRSTRAYNIILGYAASRAGFIIGVDQNDIRSPYTAREIIYLGWRYEKKGKNGRERTRTSKMSFAHHLTDVNRTNEARDFYALLLVVESINKRCF